MNPNETITDTLDALRGYVSEAQRHTTYAAKMLHDLRVTYTADTLHNLRCQWVQHPDYGNLTDDDLREAEDTAIEAIGLLAALDRGLAEATSQARSGPTCD